jgi:glutamate--cysteine ligase
MSTPLPNEPDDPGPPLRGIDELVAGFRAAEKGRGQFRVGTEHEKFGFVRKTNAPLQFDGETGARSGCFTSTAARSPSSPAARWSCRARR